jgi:hypothetical protein
MRNYVVRDLIFWFLLIFLLPLAVIVVYYLATTVDVAQSRANNGGNGEKGMEDDEVNLMMKRVFLKKALCNDGSPATYYIRRAAADNGDATEKLWVILLEGGYFCYDEESCRQRAANSFNLTSSLDSRPFRHGHGVLSTNAKENPYWNKANLVYGIFFIILKDLLEL